MLNIVICDDEPLHLRASYKQIDALLAEKPHFIQTFPAPAALLEKIKAGFLPDIAVLDIEMPETDGITLAEQLNRLAPLCKIIFLSGHTHYTYDSYRADHIWYVLKSDTEHYLLPALNKAIAALEKNRSGKKILRFRIRYTVQTLPVSRILYLERVAHSTKIATYDETLSVQAKPEQLLADLPENTFIHCHRSYWVNAEKITSLAGNLFFLSDGSCVPISRSFKKEAAETYQSVTSAG